jgi:hypothetical protein
VVVPKGGGPSKSSLKAVWICAYALPILSANSKDSNVLFICLFLIFNTLRPKQPHTFDLTVKVNGVLSLLKRFAQKRQA